MYLNRQHSDKNKWNFTSAITTQLHGAVGVQNDTFVQEKQKEDHF